MINFWHLLILVEDKRIPISYEHWIIFSVIFSTFTFRERALWATKAENFVLKLKAHLKDTKNDIYMIDSQIHIEDINFEG